MTPGSWLDLLQTMMLAVIALVLLYVLHLLRVEIRQAAAVISNVLRSQTETAARSRSRARVF